LENIKKVAIESIRSAFKRKNKAEEDGALGLGVTKK
jgi:hypothetical protein